MTEKEAWQIFKNTGSVEAYLAFTQIKNLTESKNGVYLEDKGYNTENKGHTGQG